MGMNTTNRNYKKLHTYYGGMHTAEASTSLNREAKEERMRKGNIQPYPVYVKCICYIDGFKMILKLVESTIRNQETEDGKSPVIKKSILKDVLRYVDFIKNITGEEASEDTQFLSSLIDKAELSVEDLNTLAYIANKNIVLLEQIMEMEEKEKEGRAKWKI